MGLKAPLSTHLDIATHLDSFGTIDKGALHGNTRLVKMSGRGKHSGQGERHMGIPRYAQAPIATVFENLETGMTIEEVMEEFDVTREQITAVLEFASDRLTTVGL